MNAYDLFSDASPRVQISLQIGMALIALFCAWSIVDTRRTMNWLARLGPRSWPLYETSVSMANKNGWIWFYRIDCAVIFAGIVLTLASHWLAR